MKDHKEVPITVKEDILRASEKGLTFIEGDDDNLVSQR